MSGLQCRFCWKDGGDRQGMFGVSYFVIISSLSFIYSIFVCQTTRSPFILIPIGWNDLPPPSRIVAYQRLPDRVLINRSGRHIWNDGDP